MSEYFFGLGNGRIPAGIAARANAIAERHGATLVQYSERGRGPRYWFAGPNRGEPFDRQLRASVFADLEREGLAIAGVLTWPGRENAER